MSTKTDELSQQEIAEIVETAEANLFRFWDNVAPEVAEQFGGYWREIGGATAVVTKAFPTDFFNRIIGLGVHQPATDAMIDEITALYRPLGVPWSICVSPLAQPGDLAERLLQRGFKPAYNLAKMLRGNEPAPKIETDLRIERVDKANVAHFADVSIRGFGFPESFAPVLESMAENSDVHGYIAYDGNVPAAVGLLVVKDEIGELANAVTLPEYRRHGAQGAIMARRIQDGLDLGCRWFSTETGEETSDSPNPSYHNMLRTGFKLAYLRPAYLYQGKHNRNSH
jgi:GNAT superfamily N-acetyltransferase